jgi:hypothetical protein
VSEVEKLRQRIKEIEAAQDDIIARNGQDDYGWREALDVLDSVAAPLRLRLTEMGELAC